MPKGFGPMRQETAQLRQWARGQAAHGIISSPAHEITTRKLPITLEYRVVRSKGGKVRTLYCFSDDRKTNEYGGIRQEFEDLFDLAEALTAVLEGLSGQ